MKKHLFLPAALVVLVMASCTKEDQLSNAPGTSITEQRSKSAQDLTAKDHIKIALLSDIHYMDPSLLQKGAQKERYFSTYLVRNPNKALQEYSAPIFDQVIRELKELHPDIVLIAGDMAKDGEKVSHEAVAARLQQLQDLGIKVYITPGNNDINNPEAYSYIGSSRTKVPNVSPADFTIKYEHFGYKNTIRDNNSLSYLAKPFSGLWILSIDATKYEPFVSRWGRIKPETMKWIQDIMTEANRNNITVLALMHHDVIEHFGGQNQVTDSTVIENWKATADELLAAGLKVVLTGHNHATDITTRTTNGRTLYAVQTGSLITSPSPYRVMTLKNKELDISTNYIASINAPLPDNQSFTEYSQFFTSYVMDQFFTAATSSSTSKFFLPVRLREVAVPLARNAYMAHMTGDEKLSPLEEAKIRALKQAQPDSTKTVVGAITTLWTDLNTKDNKWHIKLTNP